MPECEGEGFTALTTAAATKVNNYLLVAVLHGNHGAKQRKAKSVNRAV